MLEKIDSIPWKVLLLIGIVLLALGLFIGIKFINFILVFSGFFLIVGLVSGGRAMGGGDVKLMAAAGFVLGWKAVIVSLFLGAFSGVVFAIGRKIVSKKEMRGVIPFGPFLILGL